MSAKAILVSYALAFFVQSALSQCTSQAAVAADLGPIEPAGLAASYGFAAPGFAAPYGLAETAAVAPYGMASPCAWAAPAMEFIPTSGGSLPVSSFSAIAPFGLSVISDNGYEGILAVTGELPFVGTVAVEGVVPSAGTGAVNHACGNGINAMISETAAFAPGYAGAAYAPAAAIAPSYATPGFAAPSFAAPGLDYRVGWADRGCGCDL